MEENQNREETIRVEKKDCPVCANHPLMKTIFIGLLIFLAAYCAFYTVADWHMKRLMPPEFRHFPRKMDRMFEKDMRMMDNMLKEDGVMSKRAANVIHLEQGKNEYKVIIDLRAFDNNENNVQVLTNGNILTINGRTVKKSKNNEQISEFQQSYMFGENVRLKDLTKTTNGNYYVVTIPIGNDSDD